MRALIALMVLVSWVGQSLAQTISFQNDVNARTSMNFKTRSNIQAVIPKGSEGKILERRKLPSGNYGIKMKVTKLGSDARGNVHLGDEVWVYYHRDFGRRVVELHQHEDPQQKMVSNPEIAQQIEAIKTFRIKNWSFGSNKKAECAPAGAVDAATAQQITAQIDCLKAHTDGDVLEIDPTIEEIVTYIRVATAEDGHASNDSPELHEKIARNVKKYCVQYGVSIPLVLSIMRQESEFIPTAGSNKGAKGLMQLMPATARALAGGKKVNRSDIETNVRLAVKHIKDLSDKYSGDVTKILIAYNAGPSRVPAYVKKGSKGIPRETRSYILEIPQFLASYQSVIAKTGLAFD